ncbi:MAG: MMPL family transporter [Bradyrhizobium sp.]|uniref:hopanoid transporter HpnN n=1 Tax=Bradyrhizobium sp. TaxID=376 RepID=UPI001D6D79D1|nr:MMPL family transporter [Bradyrhizobium sp.]MBV9561492.1 MMPL family transporter [Bradyrhizobium sp.]
MISRIIVLIVDACARYRWLVLVAGVLLLVGTAAFALRHFSINTDVESLISQDLPWHARQLELNRAFPQKAISAVVSAPTAENATMATEQLAQALGKDPELFPTIGLPDSGDFFDRNGMLFGSLADVRKSAEGLTHARPIVTGLAADPSLRGIMKVLGSAAVGVQAGKLRLDQLSWPLSLAERTLNDVLSDKPASFSWQELLQGHDASLDQRRHFIEVAPRLDFSALQPGRASTEGIERVAADLALTDKLGATVDLTGPVPMNDDQFAVIRTSALRDTLTALLGVLVVLWLALRSLKIIASVLFSLVVGLAATAALGLALVGSFNLISIAFFVLFVGLGVDFGIQFSVRYRSERHDFDDLGTALRSAAKKAGKPLALAAAATAVGFFAFLPTSYRGLSELGLIAGCGMLIAFACSITLVPAMLTVLNPPGESEAVGFKRLAPLDDFLQRHRIAVIAATLLAVLAGLPLLLHLPFDFNPVNLQDPNSPSVVTYHRLQNDSATSVNDAELLAPSLDEAEAAAKRLAELPEVSKVLTLNSFVPGDQEQKIAALRIASRALGRALNPRRELPAPSDQDNVAAIRATADALARAAGDAKGAAADAARNVSALLKSLADGDAGVRSKAEAALVPSLKFDLDRLRKSLAPETVTIKTLPPNLVQDWLLPDGRARVQVTPKGNPSDTDVLRQFARAVLAAEPSAAGFAVSYYESANTVTTAFIEAGILALVAIAILLYIALRRITDVLLTLFPLLLAGIVTLEITVLWDLPLNFANIIALPLLLGVGVAFKIYYIMAWRAGKTGLLQSTLTRAVIFSAMTNAIAFGSMWASTYPGMSSMGKMMALALSCTLAFAVLFQPVLMGQPRQIKPFEEEKDKEKPSFSQAAE